MAALRESAAQAVSLSDFLVLAPSIEGVPPDIVSPPVLLRSPQVALSLAFPQEWLPALFSLDWPVNDSRRYLSGSPYREQVPLAFVREVIRSNIAKEDFDLAQLALICGTGRRRMQRIFVAHRTSFRVVRDNVRQEVAIDLVTRGDHALNDVALRSGFSGEVVFGRNYKRRAGELPGTHRRRTKSER